MIQQNIFCLVLLAAGACRGAWYTPASTLLDADTGKSSWEGPQDTENLGAQTGTHSANSSFSYFSGWSMSNVACAAAANASLSDAGISLSASDSSDGYQYNYTQAAATALVDFSLPNSQWLILNNSSSDVDPGQVSCTLNGPDGWTWTGAYGSALSAPAGTYSFSISADVERTAGIDSPSSENASLQVVPEPGMVAMIGALPFLLRRKKGK